MIQLYNASDLEFMISPVIECDTGHAKTETYAEMALLYFFWSSLFYTDKMWLIGREIFTQ